MEKVRLSIDELEVQSFTTTGAQVQQRGTVHGAQVATDPVFCPTADPAWNTCWATCGDTCGDSCGCGSGDYGSHDCYSGACGGSESFLATNCQSYGWC